MILRGDTYSYVFCRHAKGTHEMTQNDPRLIFLVAPPAPLFIVRMHDVEFRVISVLHRTAHFCARLDRRTMGFDFMPLVDHLPVEGLYRLLYFKVLMVLLMILPLHNAENGLRRDKIVLQRASEERMSNCSHVGFQYVCYV